MQPFFKKREIIHESPETAEQTRFALPHDEPNAVEAMRRIAGKFDASGIRIDMRVSVGFFDCHLIETGQGHIFTTDYREIEPPFFSS